MKRKEKKRGKKNAKKENRKKYQNGVDLPFSKIDFVDFSGILINILLMQTQDFFSPRVLDKTLQ